MKFRLTLVLSNRKTGPIPVSTSSSDTCPDSCALMNGSCYARGGPLRLQWAKVDREGVSFEAFLKLVEDKLPPRQLWRYGQAGDLPPSSEDKLRLAKANRRRPVLCYTHQRDVTAFREAGEARFPRQSVRR